MEKVIPIKRQDFLKPLSREHHHGLLLCWKIRTGIRRQVATQRIKAYTDWFCEHHIIPHLNFEEKFLYPILSTQHELIIKALTEHDQLRMLMANGAIIDTSLVQFADVLEKHIRFEERELFNLIQQIATDEQLLAIEQNSSTSQFIENESDKFWE